MSRVAPLLLLMALMVGACAQPVAPTPEPNPEQAVEPSVSDEDPVPLVETAPAVDESGAATIEPSSAPASDAAGPDTASPSPAPAGGDDPTVEPTPDPTQPPDGGGDDTIEPVVLLSVGDRAGDHGPEGPDWADLTAVEFVELSNDLRVTLQFAGDLPSQPAEGEVPLIGVDIGDDGYQLFVEGGGQSWAAYLQTPDGFVTYPGSFRLGGRSIVLQVPFSAVGSPTQAPVRVFVEWSQERLLLNAASEDKLDGEPHTFDRTS